MSPIVDTPSLSNTGSHVVPLFVVFHTPPDAVPTYTMFGLLSTTAKSSIRPPITAGPISRNSKFFSLSVRFDWPAGPACVLTPAPPQNSPAAKMVLKAYLALCIFFSLCARPGIIPPQCRRAHQLFLKWQSDP